MALEPLTIDTIKDLDGGLAGIIINRALANIAADILDRGAEDKKPRKVVITISEQVIEGDTVKIACEVQIKGPSLRTGGTLGQVSIMEKYDKNGQPQDVHAIKFNQLAPDNPKQKTIDEGTEE